MPHGLTGQAGAVTLFGTTPGTALNIKLTSWKYRGEIDWVDDTGAGELFESQVAVRKRYRVDVEGIVPNQAARHLFDADEAAFTGTTTTAFFALKHKSADTNPYVTGTAGIKEFEITHPIAGVTTATFQLICSEGVAPTFDSTPA